MSDQQQVVVRVAADGTIRAETLGIKGPRCMDYIAVLEDLLDAQTTASAFTADYNEVMERTDLGVNNDLQQW